MRWLNLGLADSDTLYGEENINAGRAQAELLPDLAEHFVKRHGFNLRRLERIAVTIGPGYYTGIRVGLAYATALAAGLGIPAVPVSGLYAIAYPLLRGGLAAASLVKARKDSVYAAIYGGCSESNIVPDVMNAAELVARLCSRGYGGRDIVIIGPDLDEFDEIKKSEYRVIQTPPAIGLSLARASLGLEAVNPALIKAAYVRPPD
jgi:tRNA threonylcarbamoyladenosine biosynthesis protein TsaB